jgi:hypothetical protein
MQRLAMAASYVGLLVCGAGAARAQTEPPMYPIEAAMRFEAWDGSAWSRSVTVNPGARIEWRIVMDYTGVRTNLTAMGEVLYQPILSNADNVGTGTDLDRYADFRNNGSSGYNMPGSLLTESEGNDQNPMPPGAGLYQGYGRVRYGQTAMTTVSSNVLTLFRHSGGSNGAPPGEWMRLAGSALTQWPPLEVPPGGLPNYPYNRGVNASQVSRALTNPQSNHTLGTSNLVIFRMALLLSETNTDARSMVLTSRPEFLKRSGGTIPTDDMRYMTWQAGDSDNGSVRVGVEFQELTINVVPAPGAAGVLLAAAALMPIRRRRCFLGGSL